MKIGVIGTGYVGLTDGCCLANFGNDVICVDIDSIKISKLKQGIMPIYEPGLKEILDNNVKAGRLIFTTDIKHAIENSDIIMIAVGTPEGLDHRPDMKYVWSVAADIGKYMNGYKVVVDKSTVPVGTADTVRKIIIENQPIKHDFAVVSNPEFLREGSAVKDFSLPDRIVLGVEDKKAEEMMVNLYSAVARTGKPIIVTSIRSAEMIKYASNAMLATRISFMNELASLCEVLGADIKEVAKGMGYDTRIGPRFLQAGVGYGGSCFPKDVQALIHMLKDNHCNASLLDAVDSINDRQKASLLPKIKKLLPLLKDKTVAIWGLSFKPKTDDMREAPSIVVIQQLQSEGAKVVAFDPVAEENAKLLFKDVEYAKTPYDAVNNADCLIIITEWDEFRELDFEKVKSLMHSYNIVDGRNIYTPLNMKKLGFNYISIGRV